jgi:hypothetical protein
MRWWATLAGLVLIAMVLVACERIVDLTIYPDGNSNPDAPDHDGGLDAFDGVEDGGIEDAVFDAVEDGGALPDSPGGPDAALRAD